jgi:hypothetical protein
LPVPGDLDEVLLTHEDEAVVAFVGFAGLLVRCGLFGGGEASSAEVSDSIETFKPFSFAWRNLSSTLQGKCDAASRQNLADGEVEPALVGGSD